MAAKLPKMTYTKNTVFHLPVQMDERTRANLREVCLYVKAGASDWVRQETGVPTMSHFSYKVPRDGEYWFSLVTIDKTGRSTPGDVSQEPPGLRVTVDTQAPVIDVQPFTNPEGELCIRCNVQDVNPDPQNIKAIYRDQAGEHAIDAVPGIPGVFKITSRELTSQSLRVTAADLCGNSATREVNVRELAALSQGANRNTPKAAASGPPLDPMVHQGVPLDTVRTESQKVSYPTPPVVDKAGAIQPPALASNTAPQVPNTAPVAPNFPQVPTTTVPQTPPSSIMQTGAVVPPVPTLPQAPAVAPNNTVKVNSTTVGNAGPRQILNTAHATIDYRIDQVGPSGVSKVEVYMTADNGLNWQRLCEDPDRRSPAEIDLPGEGLFGIRLAVTNGNGFGGTPPARGDAPTCWIEVDTTAPFIQMRPIEAAQNGVIDLRWTASDKNLGPEPITLFYKTRADAQWQVLARGVRNEGLFRWTFPRDQGSQFFVKMEVADMAGNLARAETPNPIVLDMTEPHASVVGINGVTPRVTGPVGN